MFVCWFLQPRPLVAVRGLLRWVQERLLLERLSVLARRLQQGEPLLLPVWAVQRREPQEEQRVGQVLWLGGRVRPVAQRQAAVAWARR